MIRLPRKVIAATTLVAVAPAAAVWGLRAAGVLTSFIACAALGAVLSLAACQLAAWLWQRRPGSEDVLFGDLMVWGWIRRCAAQRRLADAVSLLGLRRAIGRSDAMSLSLGRRAALLERLATDLETRDPYTHGHSRRVARYAGMIAKRMGVTGAELARIRTAAAVHDVGKLDTPIEILHKPGRLSDEEFAVVKQHPVTGASMVAILEDEELAAIVRHHHERLDGTGYPDRLAGGAIPLGARIISVADTFDAITSARPYRAAKPHRQAIEILRAEAGTQLDRDAVSAFCSVYLGRRPLGLWVAFTDFVERLVAWLVPDALSSTARVVAIAATTAAVGGGVAALPASARHGGAGRQRTSLASRAGTSAPSAARSAVAAAWRARAAGVPGTTRSRQSAARVRATGGRRTVGRVGHLPAAPRAGAGGGAGSGTGNGAPGDATTQSGGGLGTTVSTGDPTGGALGGTGVDVGVGGGSGGSGSGGGVKVSAGSSSGTANVGVSAGGGSGPGISAGVSVGSGAGGGQGSGAPVVGLSLGGSGGSGVGGSGGSTGSGDSSGSGQSGVGAQVNVPGVVSIKIHLG